MGSEHQDDRGSSAQPLIYPMSVTPGIGDGSMIQVASGVQWLRMPLHKDLKFINVWALRDGERWMLIDTGFRTPETVAAWNAAFAGGLEREGVSGVIATHMHPDHAGMAGWLVCRTRAMLWMPRLEYLTLRVLTGDRGREAPAEAIAFYRRAGWGQEAIDHYRARFGEFGNLVYPIPDAFRAIAEGDVLKIGEHPWHVIAGAGHSPEHACLYCPTLKVLISGDQVLPRISSNVSVHPLEPHADPLSDWLASLARLRSRVPDEVLVLPAHNEPFYGLHRRIDSLIEGHEQGLKRLHQALATPARAIDLFSVLYHRTITPQLYVMATGECLAHLSCLRTRGMAECRNDEHGTAWWQAL